MRSTFIERIFRKHIGDARAEQVVEALVTSPQMEAVLAEMDADNVKRRRELVAQLQTAPERHEARCREANKAKEEAGEEVTRARVALEAAMARHMHLTSVAVGQSARYELEKASLERELEKTSDPRLEVFARGCMDIFDTVRHYKPKEVHGTQWGRGRITFDVSALEEAMAALQDAAATARAMRLQALSFAEVTLALETLRLGLLPKLHAAGYHDGPAVDGSNTHLLALH